MELYKNKNNVQGHLVYLLHRIVVCIRIVKCNRMCVHMDVAWRGYQFNIISLSSIIWVCLITLTHPKHRTKSIRDGWMVQINVSELAKFSFRNL